jgi:TonB-linked SusC/RagA family outer membrane protein
MIKLPKVITVLLLMSAIVPISSNAAPAAKNGEVITLQQKEEVCSGIVSDENGPIIGASVTVKGKSVGAITDINGHFTLNGVQRGSTLTISYVGYTTKDVTWNGQQLNISMQENNQSLDEVVVVGFGTQKKVNLTGAVSTIDSKELNARPVNSVTDAMQGMIAGMNFTVGSSGGQLNSPTKFNIRGTGTIGSGSSVSPLVLIDGMEGDLNDVNPQDVDNISVLKDASASSIYGSRAAGGVILVTTKAGKAGRTSVNYNTNLRFNSPLNMPEKMDSYTWALYMNAASINAGSGAWFSDSKLAQIKKAQSDPTMTTMFANNKNQWEVWDANDILPIANTDWLKEHFGNSFSQEHNLSVTGGNDAVRYYLSGNYLGRSGLLKHGDNNQDRYTLNGRFDAKLTSWAELTYNTRFSRTKYSAPSWISDWTGGGGLFYHNVLRYWPIVPVKDPNGYYVRESYIPALEDGGRYRTNNDAISQQVTLNITPLKGWNINGQINYRIDNYSMHNDNETIYAHDCNGNAYITDNSTTSVSEVATRGNYFNPSIYTDYTRSFGDHNFKFMVGFQSELYRRHTVNASGNGVISGIASLSTTSSNPSVSGGPASWSTVGFFGRLNYDYKGRYLFEANLRRDGSSRFPKSGRWKTFPSFSAGWNIAQESFWKNLVSYVNTLKIRASWGRLGNQNTDSWYPFYSVMGYGMQTGQWLINGEKQNIASEPSLVSSSLTWEQNQTWEVGFDWGAFNNRLTGSFGVFQRKTFDMVGPAPELPAILGTNVPKVNNLDMTSTGWELLISWRDYIKDFYYGASLTLSDYKIKINKYPNDSKTLSQTYYKGAHLGDIWGYTTVGIAKSDEEMKNHLANADQSSLGSKWTAGDVMYADLNGDKKVNNGEGTADNSGDLRIIGNSTPRYSFGLNLEAAWKGFDIKVFFQGILKRDYWASGSVFWGASGINKWQATGLKAHLDYFRADANDPLGQNLNSYYPRPDWQGSRNTYTQTKYLQNAAYGRLKNLTLGYTLPKSISKKAYVENIRLFVSAENLFTITDFTELSDPELIDATNNWGFGKNYPLSKTWSVGLSVTL